MSITALGRNETNITTYKRRPVFITEVALADPSVGAVLSVNGQVGNVVITKTDLGLSNVDNTSDADKPISTATQTALDAKVPYSGATQDVDLGSFDLLANSVQLDTTPTIPTEQGSLYWDVDDNVLAVILNGVTEKVGETTFFPATNQTGSNIGKGVAVGFAGTLGNSGRILIKPYLADGSEPAKYFVGVTAEAIDNGGSGKVYNLGQIRKINTNAFEEGDILYVSSSSAGQFTTVKPTLPNLAISVAAVITKSNTVGSILVRPTILNYDYADITNTPTLVTNHSELNLDDGTNPHGTTKSDVGLGNVDNTSDLNKPISTATQNALDDKVDKVVGKQLSDENYTLTEKNKLAGIEDGAEVNTVDSVNGQTGVVVLDATDVSAYPDTNPSNFVDATGAAAAAPVQSVNGQTGSVSLSLFSGDYNDLTNKPTIPTLTSQLTNDSGFITSAGAPVQSVNSQTGTVVLTATDVGAYPDTNPSNYIDASGAPVQSVAGKTGTVTLVKGDVGLGNVDNTSDLNKPISTATQTALNGKVDETVATTGTAIDFTAPKVFGSSGTPETGNITEDLTGAVLGTVQKIYHNHSVTPTVPAGWVLLSGEYVLSSLNIIYVEYVSVSRVEYWIIQEGVSADDLLLETTTQTANYTLALTDQNKVVPMDGTDLVLAVPTNASVAFPIGSVVNIYNLNATTVTVQGDAGVTVRNAGALAQYGEISLRKRATDEWVAAGNLA